MSAVESQYLDQFSNNPTNYLYDWARRTNNLGNLASYFVQVGVDQSTGRAVGFIRPTSDGLNAAIPTKPYAQLAGNRETVAGTLGGGGGTDPSVIGKTAPYTGAAGDTTQAIWP